MALAEVLLERGVPVGGETPHVIDQGNEPEPRAVDDGSEVRGLACLAELPEPTDLGLHRAEAVAVRRSDERHPSVGRVANVPKPVSWLGGIEVEDSCQ